MPPALSFLVVEDESDGQVLIERALLWKFPNARVAFYSDADAAAIALQEHEWSGVIVHRALDATGTEIVGRLRALNQTTTILFISGRDNASGVVTGASHCLHYGDWKRVGEFFSA